MKLEIEVTLPARIYRGEGPDMICISSGLTSSYPDLASEHNATLTFTTAHKYAEQWLRENFGITDVIVRDT